MTSLQAYLSDKRIKKILKSKPGDEGFSLIELVVVVAVLAVLSAIAIPSFMSITDKARAAAASNTVATVAKECAVKIANDSSATHTYASVTLDGYNPFTVNGSGTNCSDTGKIEAPSKDTSKYPTFVYDIDTGAKTCTASGDAVKLGCTNSKW